MKSGPTTTTTRVDLSPEEAAFLQPTSLPKNDSELDFNDSWGGGFLADLPNDPFSSSSTSLPAVGGTQQQDASFFMGSLIDDDDDDDESGASNSIYNNHIRPLPQASTSDNETKNSNNNDDNNAAILKPPTLARARSDDFMYKTSQNKYKSFGTSAYRGPTPLGPDGKPLKSSFRNKKKSTSLSSQDFNTLLTNDNNNNITEQTQSQQQQTKLKRSVSFNQINMRKYERALGDHPCVSSGAPITLGWKFNQYDSIPLDDYETARGPTLSKNQIRIPADVRLNMLIDQADVSLKEVKDAEIKAMRERAELIKSMRSANNKKGQKMEELGESARRKLKRIVSGRSKKRQEDELWKNAQEHALKKMDGTSGNGGERLGGDDYVEDNVEEEEKERRSRQMAERSRNPGKFGRRWST